MGGNESRPGYRVVEVIKNSPSEKAGIQPYLDFIMSLNGTNLLESSLPFQEMIKSNENCCVTLEVLSLVDMSLREVRVTPEKWEGEGLLGVNLRYEDSIEALNRIIHVTKVFPNSAASNAGLLEGEFIIGSKEALIKDALDIRSIIEKNGNHFGRL